MPDIKKEDKFVVKISCELDDESLENITNQMYEKLIEKFEKKLLNAFRKV